MYEDIFNQIRNRKKNANKAREFILKTISQHRYQSLKTRGYLRVYHNNQANILEKELKYV